MLQCVPACCCCPLCLCRCRWPPRSPPLPRTCHRPPSSARLWDRTRLPLPLPPLMRHPDVVAAIEAARIVRSGPVPVGSGGVVGRGPLDQPCLVRSRPVACAAVVADARRRTHRNSRPVRRPPLHPGEPHRPPRRADARPAHAARRPDAQPRRRRTATATQRTGHRHQPRRAAAANARGPGAQGAARPGEPAHRLQPPQPELAHLGRQDGQAGGDVAAGRVV